MDCLGKMIENDHKICFEYDEKKFKDGPLEYFKSYPTLAFVLQDRNGDNFDFIWYPSEYLYRHSTEVYCVAAEIQNGSEIMMGGTMLRQHNLIFDIENEAIGFAHAVCSDDPNQVLTT